MTIGTKSGNRTPAPASTRLLEFVKLVTDAAERFAATPRYCSRREALRNNCDFPPRRSRQQLNADGNCARPIVQIDCKE